MYTQAKQKFGFLNWICCSYINSAAFSSVLKIGLSIIFTLIALFPQVIVLWTANTERFCDVRAGLNDTAENLLNSICRDEAEVSPSTIFAVASILEGVAYINGSPQNTFVPGCIELAEKHKVSSVLGISCSYFSFSSSSFMDDTHRVDYAVNIQDIMLNWQKSKEYVFFWCMKCWGTHGYIHILIVMEV